MWGAEMNLKQMRLEVENIIDDVSYDAPTIDSYINSAIELAAARVSMPSLKGIGTVNTDADSYLISIAEISGEHFDGSLRMAIRSDGVELNIHENVERLLSKFPEMNTVGSPTDCALEGNKLYYHPVPSTAESIMLVFYKRPTLLSRDADTPSDFPVHVHRFLFVHGSAWLIYDQIEDGIDEEGKNNTLNHFAHSFDEKSKRSGITLLREWLGKNKVHHISSVWRY